MTHAPARSTSPTTRRHQRIRRSETPRERFVLRGDAMRDPARLDGGATTHSRRVHTGDIFCNRRGTVPPGCRPGTGEARRARTGRALGGSVTVDDALAPAHVRQRLRRRHARTTAPRAPAALRARARQDRRALAAYRAAARRFIAALRFAALPSIGSNDDARRLIAPWNARAELARRGRRGAHFGIARRRRAGFAAGFTLVSSVADFRRRQRRRRRDGPGSRSL